MKVSVMPYVMSRAFTMACALATIAATFGDGVANKATAQSANLKGSWSGSGRVVLPSGDVERARCRASFKQQTPRSFSMNAICATSSVRIVQSATLRQVSGGEFAGQFYNREYDISGSIRVTLRGDRLSAFLSGGGGSGAFDLRK